MKKCSKCLQIKPYTEFSKRRNSPDGYNFQCLQCVQEYNRDRYRTIPEVKEQSKQRVKEWLQSNREQHREYHQQWVQDNLEHHRMYKRAAAQKRRALEYSAEGVITAELVDSLYNDSNDHCFYCDVRLNGIFHVDHMQPISRGGSNLEENLCICCPRCNLEKNDKTFQEWYDVRGW